MTKYEEACAEMAKSCEALRKIVPSDKVKVNDILYVAITMLGLLDKNDEDKQLNEAIVPDEIHAIKEEVKKIFTDLEELLKPIEREQQSIADKELLTKIVSSIKKPCEIAYQDCLAFLDSLDTTAKPRMR